jgi:geranylgeranylglycerol-phosphate geranylgeranyltransferase
VLTLRAIVQLTRLETSLLGFLAVFVPLFVRNDDLSLSFRRAIPLLFVSICTFVANDLDDIEKDKVNHPDRPLPAGHFSPVFAVVLYFTSLALALFSTRYFISPGIDFLYYGAISLSISYGYIAEYIPILKTPYVAIAATVPILIVAASYPNEARLYIVAGSVFLMTLGREICMDIKDRAGDPVSFMHRFRPMPLGGVAFSIQTLGLILLVILINGVGDTIDWLAMTFLLLLAGVFWFKFESYKLALILMKVQLFIGLYFLI